VYRWIDVITFFCSSGFYDAFVGDLVGCFLVGRGRFYGFYLVVVLFCYGICLCLLLLLLLFLVFVYNYVSCF
jgi:hypothetical protein